MDVEAAERTSGPPSIAGTIPDTLLQWAQRPGTASLLDAVRGRVEAGKATDGSRFRVQGQPARADVGRMLGVKWELSTADVTLKRLQDSLAAFDVDLRTLLTAVGGPLRDLRGEQQAAREESQRLWSASVDLLTSAGVPENLAEVALRRRWLGPPGAASQATAGQVAAASAALPIRPFYDGPHGRLRGLAEFAGQELGDPHVLDKSRPAGRALAKLIAASAAGGNSNLDAGNVEALAVAAAREVGRASGWRAAWAQAGVVCDQVSSTVLLLNVPMAGTNPALKHVTSVRGEPVWVTARMTHDRCEPVRSLLAEATAPKEVLVCENPSVVEAAADALGAACPPLICIYGRPSIAAWAVLEALAVGGHRLVLSTDRDTAGGQIAAEISTVLRSRSGAVAVCDWLPQADGSTEEERLEAFLDDLRRRASKSSPSSDDGRA